MLKYFAISQGIIRESAPDTGIAALESAHWVDAIAPDEAERELLGRLMHEEPPVSEEVEEIEASARFFVDHDGIHVHSLFLTTREGRHVPVSVACILQTDRLITIRDEELPDFRLLRMRARRGQVECASPADLLVTLLDQKVENLADIIEGIHHELEACSASVLEDDNARLEDAIGRLARQEDSNGKVRLCLMDTQRAFSFLQRHLRQQTELQVTCNEVRDDIETLLAHSAFLFEKINFLMESTQGFISIEQNKIIKIFSIAAVVFLPPTLVASIYGMNFMHMPELEWLLGYPWALGLMLISGIAPYLIFKHKGWL